MKKKTEKEIVEEYLDSLDYDFATYPEMDSPKIESITIYESKLLKKKNPTKTFIGGLVIGIVVTTALFYLNPYINTAIDAFNNWVINLFM